jgi:hypothetical protein
VIGSAALRPDACNVEINCCHAASDGLMVRVWSDRTGTRSLRTESTECMGVPATLPRPVRSGMIGRRALVHE